MNAPLKHTFVIPAYGQSGYLQGCIESIMQQTVPSRVVMVTATPNAHLTALAAQYNIPLLHNPHGGTIGRDWNFAFNAATTPYVTLAHQDDVYLPQFAERCIALAEKHAATRPLIVFNPARLYHGTQPVRFSVKNMLRWLLVMPFHFKRGIGSKGIKKSILLFSNSISCPGVFFVKQNLPGFSFNPTARYILDWQAWYHLSQQSGSFIYCPTALHIHREHPESATQAAGLSVLQHEETELLTQIWGNRLIPALLVRLLRLAK